MKIDKIKVNLSDFPIDSSLGLLAYGDIAFKAWRELKKKNNSIGKDEQE